MSVLLSGEHCCSASWDHCHSAELDWGDHVNSAELGAEDVNELGDPQERDSEFRSHE